MNSVLKITRKELLKEVAGISYIVREWAKILKQEVTEQNRIHKEKELEKVKTEPKKGSNLGKDDPFYWEDEFSKGTGTKGKSRWSDYDDWFSSYSKKNKREKQKGYYSRRYEDDPYATYSGYNVTTPYIQPLQEITVLGQKYPEQYKKFSVDKWVFKNSSRIEYDHWHSGYDEAGNYVVYFNVPISNLSEAAFIHEIKHAYDDWNRMSRGGKPIRDSWEIKNIYTPDFEKLVLGGSTQYPQLGPLIRYFYLGSKLETPAYLENEYDAAFTDYEGVARKMKNFDIKNYFDKEGRPARGLEEEFESIKKLNIPAFKKYKNVTDFLNWVKKYFNERGEDIYRRVVKMKYVHGKPVSPFTPKPVTQTSWEPKKGTETASSPSKTAELMKSKETGKQKKEDEFDFEEGESMGEWKFSKERGWHLPDDFNFDDIDDFEYYD